MSDDPKVRILDAAEIVFADRGLAGARVAAIAEAADVNKAMLYYYFGSKEDLYKAVLGRVAALVGGLAREALSDAQVDPLDRLEAFMDGYRTVLGTHPNFARIMVRELMDGAQRVGPLFREAIGPVIPLVAMTLAQTQRDGALNPAVSFPMAGPVMISPFIFIAFARPMLEQVFGPLDEEFADEYHRSAKEIILNGLRARKEDA